MGSLAQSQIPLTFRPAAVAPAYWNPPAYRETSPFARFGKELLQGTPQDAVAGSCKFVAGFDRRRCGAVCAGTRILTVRDFRTLPAGIRVHLFVSSGMRV